MLRAGEYVGTPADLSLEIFGSGGHDFGVEPDTGHDEEHVLFDLWGVFGVGGIVEIDVARLVLAVLTPGCQLVGSGPSQPQRARVDVGVAPGEHHRHRAAQRIDRQRQIAGQQIAGAAGQEADGHSGAHQRRRHVADRAVAPERAHDVDPGLDGLAGLSAAGLLHGRLGPPRVGPALAGAHPADHPANFGDVVELGRVDDDGRTLLGVGRLGLHRQWVFCGAGPAATGPQPPQAPCLDGGSLRSG